MAPKKTIRYFFFHGDLHKKIHINRGADVITAWNYRAGRTLKYSYADVKKHGERAFTTTQVCKLVQRGRTAVEMAIINGHIREPQYNYKLGPNPDKRKFAYYWCEKDILDLHAYLSTVHRGRPRKDGLTTTVGLPTASELRAMIRHNLVTYVKDDDGNFIPTYDADRF